MPKVEMMNEKEKKGVGWRTVEIIEEIALLGR